MGSYNPKLSPEQGAKLEKKLQERRKRGITPETKEKSEEFLKKLKEGVKLRGSGEVDPIRTGF